MVKGPDGKPKLRPENLPPTCSVCPKFDAATGKPWRGFTPRNEYYFMSFLVARKFGQLPRTGRIDNQDVRTLNIFVALGEMFDYADKISEKEFMMKLTAKNMRL